MLNIKKATLARRILSGTTASLMAISAVLPSIATQSVSAAVDDAATYTVNYTGSTAGTVGFYKDDGSGSYVLSTTSSDGSVKLPAGKYRMQEVDPAPGYEISTDAVYFDIAETAEVFQLVHSGWDYSYKVFSSRDLVSEETVADITDEVTAKLIADNAAAINRNVSGSMDDICEKILNELLRLLDEKYYTGEYSNWDEIKDDVRDAASMVLLENELTSLVLDESDFDKNDSDCLFETLWHSIDHRRPVDPLAYMHVARSKFEDNLSDAVIIAKDTDAVVDIEIAIKNALNEKLIADNAEFIDEEVDAALDVIVDELVADGKVSSTDGGFYAAYAFENPFDDPLNDVYDSDVHSSIPAPEYVQSVSPAATFERVTVTPANVVFALEKAVKNGEITEIHKLAEFTADEAASAVLNADFADYFTITAGKAITGTTTTKATTTTQSTTTSTAKATTTTQATTTSTAKATTTTQATTTSTAKATTTTEETTTSTTEATTTTTTVKVIEIDVVVSALQADEPVIVLDEETGNAIDITIFEAVVESDKIVTIVLNNGLEIKIDPAKIDLEKIAELGGVFILNIDIIPVAKGDDYRDEPSMKAILDIVELPEAFIIIAPSTHGEFGFEVEFTVSAEALETAGLNPETTKLYHISDNGLVTEIGSAVLNEDGSITIAVSRASRYILTDIKPVINPNLYNIGDINEDGCVDAADASMALEIYASVSTGNGYDVTGKLLAIADVDKSGVIDANDSSLILAYYAHVMTYGEDALSAEEYFYKAIRNELPQ